MWPYRRLRIGHRWRRVFWISSWVNNLSFAANSGRCVSQWSTFEWSPPGFEGFPPGFRSDRETWYTKMYLQFKNNFQFSETLSNSIIPKILLSIPSRTHFNFPENRSEKSIPIPLSHRPPWGVETVRKVSLTFPRKLISFSFIIQVDSSAESGWDKFPMRYFRPPRQKPPTSMQKSIRTSWMVNSSGRP